MEKLICSKCNTENDPKNLFCQTCGAVLSAPAPSDSTVIANRPPTPAPPPTPAYVPPVPVQAAPPPSTPPVMQAPAPAPTYAQPQAYGQPPAPAYGQPPAYGYAPAPMYMGTPIKDLGLHVDGWSDVIEDGADLAPKVKKSFNEIMTDYKIPGLRITEVSLTNGEMENRPYLLMSSAPGATIAVRIAPFGKNLIVSWDMYTKRQPNWLTLGLLGGIVFVLTLTNILTTGYYYGDFFAGLFGFISTFLTWMVWPSLILLLLGKVFKDDWLGLFVKDLNPFAADDVDSLSTLIDNALTDAVEASYEEPEPEPAPEKAKAKK